MDFKTAFAQARKKLGAGKEFTWNGKKYSTNRADDVKKSTASPTKPVKRPDMQGPTPKPSVPSTPSTPAPKFGTPSGKQAFRDAATLRRKKSEAGPVQGPSRSRSKNFDGNKVGEVSTQRAKSTPASASSMEARKQAFRKAKTERRKARNAAKE